MFFELCRMSRQVFRTRFPLTTRGVRTAHRSRRGCSCSFLVTGDSVLRAGRHCCGALAVLAEKRGLCTHPPTLPDQRVRNIGCLILGCELRSAYPAATAAGRGAGLRRQTITRELATLSLGLPLVRRGNRGCSPLALGVAPAASLRASSDVGWFGFVA